ncbi:hypothetical protein [Plantactinospora soyae]|uniref:Uncharacterized protein n=1 Tax=Plantactinospora soyae TaxID=1544732 RepID=A0A927M313_9ACTN|nr:hypothetical protein [Plantactinospora soyae]MBE1485861.1 hypothetical protein [Plantactinospora soyae]
MIHTLFEVAQMTGLSLRSIQNGCRHGRIEHTARGAGTIRIRRGMTGVQVEKLLAQRTVKVASPAQPELEPLDDLAEAKAATRRRLARYSGRSTAGQRS